MKTKLILTTSIIALMTGCGGGSDKDEPIDKPTEQQVVTPKTVALAQKYKYQIVFVDSLTGELVTDELQANIQGTATVVGLDGKTITKNKALTVKDGRIPLAADLNDDEFFTVVAGNRDKGWQESGIQIAKRTSQEDGVQTVIVKLTNIGKAGQINSDLALGLSIATSDIALDSGATQTTPAKMLTANAEGNPESNGVASITIPAGIKALDASGKAINTASGATLTTIKFSNGEARSLAAFPGGFAPSVELADGTTANNGSFISGGFAQFNLTDKATGQALKKFDKPLELAIDLPKNSKSPDGKPLQAGDTYPVWSFDETSGKWKFETNGVIAEKTGDADNFTVNFQSNHLSYWNLDYYVNTCDAPVNFQRAATDNRPLNVELIGAVGTRFSHTAYGIADSNLTFGYYPRGQQATVKVYDASGVLIAEDKTAKDLCNGTNITIPAPTTPLASLTVNVTESCPDGSNKRALPAYVDLFKFPNYSTKYINGSGTFPGLSNGTATLYVWNARTWNYRRQTVNIGTTQTVDVNFDDLQCKPVTGAAGSAR